MKKLIAIEIDNCYECRNSVLEYCTHPYFEGKEMVIPDIDEIADFCPLPTIIGTEDKKNRV